MPPWKMLIISLFVLGALSGCNCENQVAVEEVPACEDVMGDKGFPENEDACDACCIAEGFDMGSPFGTVSEAENQYCNCGNKGTCDEE